MSNLIESSELHSLLGEPAVRIVDTRFDLSDTDAGERAYRAGHIPGAVYGHLDRHLSGPRGRHGGRHPLPEPDELASLLSEFGVGNDSMVVAYDAGNGMFASRLWWLLKYLGHDRVRVLNGGLAAWLEEGYPLSEQVPRPPAACFEARVRPTMAVDRDYVLRHLDDPTVLLVDARAPERYLGEVEPLDPRAGHIPSAVNLPFAGNLENGRFRDRGELRRRFGSLEDRGEVIVYCGSGVSAAHDVLAMEEAGLSGVRLYHGSWSDWCSYEDAPLATGEEA
jgi:thiosulfate/3-mercaptopyruvate sulfurtransferase